MLKKRVDAFISKFRSNHSSLRIDLKLVNECSCKVILFSFTNLLVNSRRGHMVLRMRRLGCHIVQPLQNAGSETKHNELLTAPGE